MILNELAQLARGRAAVKASGGINNLEQAIALAQTGMDPDDIGRELGLTRDAAETITVFRKH